MKKFDKTLHMLVSGSDGLSGEILARVNEDGIRIQKYNASKISDDMVIDFLNAIEQFKKFKSKHPNLSVIESNSKNVPEEFLFGE